MSASRVVRTLVALSWVYVATVPASALVGTVLATLPASLGPSPCDWDDALFAEIRCDGYPKPVTFALNWWLFLLQLPLMVLARPVLGCLLALVGAPFAFLLLHFS